MTARPLRLALIAFALAACATAPRATSGAPDAGGQPYDLVLRGGRVMDPESGLDAVRDEGTGRVRFLPIHLDRRGSMDQGQRVVGECPSR